MTGPGVIGSSAEQRFQIGRRLIAMKPMLGSIGITCIAWIAVTAHPGAQTMSAVSVAHEYVPSTAVAPGQLSIPSNVRISSVYRKLVDDMLRRSPTFRRQVLRLASARHLTVNLQAAAPPWQRSVRATTKFDRDRVGGLSAQIEILPMHDPVELIAHEIEHVIEQLDDVDLETKADRANSGVRSATSGGVVFETTRATRTGLQVVQEVR